MFYLFAIVQFMPGGYASGQAAFDKLTKYVRDHEPTTQTYYFGVPLDNEHNHNSALQMLGFEAYDDRKALYETHMTSQIMGEGMQQAAPNLLMKLSELENYALAAGFLDAPGDNRDCGVIYDLKIVCKSQEARAVVRTRLEKLAAKIEETSSKDEVLTWMVFEHLDSETNLRVYGRWKNKAALEATNTLPDVLRFWEETRDSESGEIVKITGRGYAPNGKGWLHR